MAYSVYKKRMRQAALLVLYSKRMQLWRKAIRIFAAAITITAAYRIVAQPPHPPLPPPAAGSPEDARHLEARLKDIERRLPEVSPGVEPGTELAAFVKTYLKQAQSALAERHMFAAARFADAADDCRRPLDHLRHIAEGSREPGPKTPAPAADRLRQVYFRLRLSEYFLQQIPDPKPKRLLELARTFYQDSLKAAQAGESVAADEYGTCADDLTHALEHLAQATRRARLLRHLLRLGSHGHEALV